MYIYIYTYIYTSCYRVAHICSWILPNLQPCGALQEWFRLWNWGKHQRFRSHGIPTRDVGWCWVAAIPAECSFVPQFCQHRRLLFERRVLLLLGVSRPHKAGVLVTCFSQSAIVISQIGLQNMVQHVAAMWLTLCWFHGVSLGLFCSFISFVGCRWCDTTSIGQWG